MPVGQWKFRVRHIIENIQRVDSFVQGMSCERFCADERTVFAVVTCFSIIGEAARLVPKTIKDAYPEVPWSQMTRMRNVLVHEYDRIDLGMVWSTITDDLPGLTKKLQRVLEEDTDLP